MNITEKLFEKRDAGYALFQAKLTPGIPPEAFIGVRIPDIRRIAKEYAKDPESEEFLASLPHGYYDENILHGSLISMKKDYDECICLVDAFLPYVDNWAVCDTMSPKVFAKHRPELIIKIREWIKSGMTYTCRFGIEMLMSHFLDEYFRPEYNRLPAEVRSEEYYVNMMIAWYYATALAKQWDDTVKILEDGSLGDWVQNKTIRKARESFRITDEQKEYLKTLKRAKL